MLSRAVSHSNFRANLRYNFLLSTKSRNCRKVSRRAGCHLPGILVLRRQADIGQVIADLVLIAEAADDDEYLDRISYVPLA